MKFFINDGYKLQKDNKIIFEEILDPKSGGEPSGNVGKNILLSSAHTGSTINQMDRDDAVEKLLAGLDYIPENVSVATFSFESGSNYRVVNKFIKKS